MKVPRIFSSVCVAVAVMLLLSVTVHPVMAAEATKEQFASFGADDIEMITVEELVPDATGELVTASSADDIQEYRSEKATIRIKDPMADQHSPDVSAFSASSADDEVAAAIPEAIDRMDQEGYDFTGQSEHQYQTSIASDKFRALDSRQRALLKSADLGVEVGESAAVTGQGDVQYYFFTNRTTGATRIMTVSQMIDHEGRLIGERNLVLTDDIDTSDAGTANDGSTFSASRQAPEGSDLEKAGMALMFIGVGLGVAALVAGGCGVGIFWAVLIGVIALVVFVVGAIILNSAPDPTPTPTPAPRPSSNIDTFGNTSALTRWPSGESYSRLGGASAIRLSGTMDTFIGNLPRPEPVWVQSTYGVAIQKDGTIMTWTPGLSGSFQSFILEDSHKKYRAVSRFCEGDWALAIYEDDPGDSRIDMFYKGVPLDANHTTQVNEFKAKYPELFEGWPKDTGWLKVSAGNSHALAIRPDGRVYAWGNNTYNQLDLTTYNKNGVFIDIAAGKDFSLGLLEPAIKNDDKAGLLVMAIGKDEYHQVADMYRLPPGKFIAIEAGTTRSAVLDHAGTIINGGENWTGTQPPTGTGYTDIVLGPDYGFALREAAPERHITGPISPGNTLMSREGTGEIIPVGSIIRHTHNGVIRVFAPNGTELFWANDEEASHYRFPEGTSFPVSVVHYVTPFSLIYSNDSHQASLYKAGSPHEFPALLDNLKGASPLMTVYEDSWVDEQSVDTPPTLPQAVCIDGKCSVGATSRGQLILSDPLQKSGPAGNFIPVFSVRQNSPHFYRATLSTLGSTSEADTRAILIQKSRVDPDQPVGFNIITGNGSIGGTNVFVTGGARMTNQSNVIIYNLTATSSLSLASFKVQPLIWNRSHNTERLVYSGPITECENVDICSVSGIYNVTKPGTYFVNASITYHVPQSLHTTNGMNSVIVAPESQIIDVNVSTVINKNDPALEGIDPNWTILLMNTPEAKPYVFGKLEVKYPNNYIEIIQKTEDLWGRYPVSQEYQDIQQLWVPAGDPFEGAHTFYVTFDRKKMNLGESDAVKMSEEDHKLLAMIQAALIYSHSVTWPGVTHQDVTYYTSTELSFLSAYSSTIKDHSVDPDIYMPDPLTTDHAYDPSNGWGNAPANAQHNYSIAIEKIKPGRTQNLNDAAINFAWADHFLSDVGNPMHTGYYVQQALDCNTKGECGIKHMAYENYIAGNWDSGHHFKNSVTSVSGYVTGDTGLSIEDQTKNAAQYSNQYLTYLWDTMGSHPTSWQNDPNIVLGTKNCLTKSRIYSNNLAKKICDNSGGYCSL